MGVHHSLPRRKVEQFQTHGQDDPSHNQTRPRGPQPTDFAEPLHREPGPQNILNDSYGDVCRHVVRVVETHEGKVRDMHEICADAKQRPGPQDRSDFTIEAVRAIEAEDADRGEVKAVHDVRSGAEVIELFREIEISRVEDHAEDPRGQSNISKHEIVLAQAVSRRNLLFQSSNALLVGEEIEEGEQNAGGLLNA